MAGRDEIVSPPLLTAGVKNAMLRSFLQIGSADRVVDLGCGNGRFLVWTSDTKADLLGIDAAPYFAEETRRDIDLLVGDLRRLPLADGVATKGYSLDVCEHLSLDGLTLMLKEAGRVLAPGGALFLFSHVRQNTWIALGPMLIHHLAFGLDRIGVLDLSMERLRKSDHLNPLATIADLRHVADESGFRIEKLRYYTPLFGGLFETLLVPLVERVENLVARWWTRATSTSREADSAPTSTVRSTRLAIKRRIARRGVTFMVLSALTKVAMLDIILFSRVRTGPFFALLVKK